MEALLAVELALARAEARVGLIPESAAQAIERAVQVAEPDADALGREAAATGSPVVPLVRYLRQLVGESAAASVHRGATSQDILDTATMIVVRNSLAVIVNDMMAAADAAARLARTHRDTPVAGRTLLQQALPTTFGLKAAVWMTGLDEAVAGLKRVRDERLAVQLGGAAGTLAAFGSHGPRLVAALADELGLRQPVLPWHTQRNRIGELASALGVAAGAAAKPARDIVLLAQTEVGEVHEGDPARGRSSTLPHKRNPVAAVSALAAAEQAPGLVATLLGAMAHEHERAAGAWHAEWPPLRQLLLAVGSAVSWLADSLAHLEVDVEAMARNLERGHGLILAERIAGALERTMGRDGADAFVSDVAREAADAGQPFDDLLRARVAELPEPPTLDLDELLDHRGYLGSATELVDRALAAHDALRTST
jgi:3-carboxy-cis,cis-muconate cycloisomerase